jgi:hypothetical protein
METIMFAIGVLTMVLVALAALAVYSTVMVLKLKKENNDFQRQLHDVYRVISEREDSLYRTMHEETRELRLQIDQAFERVDQLNSYVDRRIDKVIDGYLLVKEAEQESKKLIKG